MHFDELPSGSWRVTVSHGGQRRRATGKTKGEARLLGAQLMLDMGGTPSADPTMQEVIDAHLVEAEYAVRTRAEIIRAHDRIPSVFLARRASEVTPLVLAGLWREMAKAGVTPHVVRRARDLLSKAWQRARAYEWVQGDPFDAAPAPIVPASRRIVPPEPEQVRALIASAGSRPLALWLRLAAVIGARRGELCGLQWDDLDLDHAQVIIRRSIAEVKGSGVFETIGKTGEAGHRVVPLDLPTVAALRKHRRIVGCPWVFSHDGATPWRPSYVTREFGRLRTNGVRVHDLRHYAATRWLANGEQPATVAHLLGHSTPATTLRIYAHYIPAQARGAIEAGAAALDG